MTTSDIRFDEAPERFRQHLKEGQAVSTLLRSAIDMPLVSDVPDFMRSNALWDTARAEKL